MRITCDLSGSESLADRLITYFLPHGFEAMSFVDLGCGDAPRTRWIRFGESTWVDPYPRPGSPSPLIRMDAVEFLKTSKVFDVTFSLDMIEHLDKEKGREFLRLMDAKTRHLAVLFTPLGEMLLNPSDPMGHRSGWLPEEFENIGWHTIIFPRFHNPWQDGRVWGAFFAVRTGDLSRARAVLDLERVLAP